MDIQDVTGFPEICEGRVKTLHPKVHGGLLARRDSEDHMKQIGENDIEPIDLVCVNLYPFEETIAKPDVTMEEAIENIDIERLYTILPQCVNYKGRPPCGQEPEPARAAH